jgi:hypothetical protein
VWDRISTNDFADAVSTALTTLFPGDPPRFLPSTPYGYHDPAAIARDLADGGFDRPDIVTLPARSRADSALMPAIGFCHGTPVRMEIEARDPNGLDTATRHAAAQIAQRFGEGPIDAAIQAHVVIVRR